MANETYSKWAYPLTEISQDKRVPLPAVSENYAGELAGIDGSLQGGLRPFSGFKEVYELDCTSDPLHTTDSRVVDFFPVTFNIDFDTYGYGFVYRMLRPDLFASTSFTFSGSMTINETITLTDALGTTKTYRAVLHSDITSNGELAAAVAATGPEFTFTASNDYNVVTDNTNIITLVSTDGTRRTYEGTDQVGFTGKILENGNIGFNVDLANGSTTATNFGNALTASLGHNGKITFVRDGAKITLTQNVAGSAGNTTVTADQAFIERVSETSISNFSGGLDTAIGFKTGVSFDQNDVAPALRDAIMSSNGHNGTIVTVWTAGTGKLTLTQNTKGSEGNTAILVSSGWAAKITGTMPAVFVGGADTGEADLFLDFYLANCQLWSRGNLIKANIDPSAPMDVKSTGRILVAAVQGQSPTVVYISRIKPDSQFVDPNSIYCIDVGDCTSSEDGVYCPASARLEFNEEVTAEGSTRAASTSFSFTNYAVNDSHILIQSTDGTIRRYRATDGGTTGLQEVEQGTLFTQFDSGRSRATAGFTLNAAPDVGASITLIDGNALQRTYISHGSETSTIASSQASTATCTFSAAAPEGATLTLTDVAGTTKTYIAVSTGSTGDLDSNGFVTFLRGTDGNSTVSSIRTALTHSNGHNGTITAADPSGGSVLTMTQTTAGDGNTVIGQSNLSGVTDPDLPARFSGGGKTINFARGGDQNDSAPSLRNAILSSNGHNGTILAVWTAGTGQLALTQTIFDDTSTSTTISHTTNWDSFCSVNPPDAFSIADSAATQATAAATNLKAAIDDANGHNATSGTASLTFDFTGAATNNGIINLISSGNSDGSSEEKTLNYKATTTEADNLSLTGSTLSFFSGTNAQTAAENLAAAINSRFGHNGKDKQASVRIAFSDVATNDGIIALIGAGATSSDATLTRRYQASSTETNQFVVSGSNTKFFSGTSKEESAQNFVRAVNSENGHGLNTTNGIVATNLGNGHVELKQVNPGIHGETNITYTSISSSLTSTPSKFDNGSEAVSGFRFNVATEAASSNHKITITQVRKAKDKNTAVGNTAVTTAGSFGPTASSVPSNFSGGVFSASTNARFTVTANATPGSLTLLQSTAGRAGNTVISATSNFSNAANPSFRFEDGGTIVDGAEVTLVNTQGDTHTFHFDRDSTKQDGTLNDDGEYIVGIQNETTIEKQTSAFFNVLEAVKDTTEITAFKTQPNEVLLRQQIAGEAGNTSISLNADAARFITATNFSGGNDPISLSSSSSSSASSCLGEYFLVIENNPGPGLRPNLEGPTLGPVSYLAEVPSDVNRSSNGQLYLSDEQLNDGDYAAAGKLLADSDLPIIKLLDRPVNDIVLNYNTAFPDDVLDCDGIYTDTDGGEDDITDTTSADNPQCDAMNTVVSFIGSNYGGRQTSIDSRPLVTNYCIFENDSIEKDNFVNQLPIVQNNVFISELADIKNIAVDIQFRKKELDSNEFGDFQSIITGGHLVLDQFPSTEMFVFNVNSQGGFFATYKNVEGRNRAFAVEHQPAMAARFANTTCYVLYTNLQQFFGCDHFSPGDYEFKISLRRICCDPTTVISSTFSWEIGEGACNFGEQDSEQTRDKKKLESGNYVFAYNLYDSKTGRTSALSTVSQVTSDSFKFTDQTTAEAKFASIELIYDHNKFDFAYFYRSVKTQDAGGTFTAGVLGLDKIIRLKDYRTIRDQPTQEGYSRAVYTYELGDLELVYRPTYSTESPIFDQNMPFGGKLEWFSNTLLVSAIRDTPKSTTDEINDNDTMRSIGELRFSSMIEMSPELFPPFNRYVPPVPSNEMIALKMVGDTVFGFSRDRIYNIRKEASRTGGYLRVMEMHEGFGITGPNALESVGSSVYYLTPKGVKAVNTQGRLDDIKAFDNHILKNWPRDLSSVECAFDPASSVMFWLDPSTEEALCLWFNSSKSSILKDMAFKSVKRGPWPSDPTNYNDNLVDRALFLQNPPSLSQGFRPRIYVHDYRYQKTITGSGLGGTVNGQRRISMMDGDGDTRFNTHGTASSSVITLDNTDGTLVSNSWVGSYLYVADSSTSSMIGKKAKIVKIQRHDIDELVSSSSDYTLPSTAQASNFANITVEGSDLDGLPAGSRVFLSPVYFRWIGHNVGMKTKEGITFAERNYHRVKHVETVNASFTDVSGPPLLNTDTNKDNRYRGLAFEGGSFTPVDTAYPVDLNGGKIASVISDDTPASAAFGGDDTLSGRYGVEGRALSPGLEVYCSDLDFLLLSVMVEGKVRSSSKTDLGNIGV